jgi:hypothetical protein
VDALAVEKSLHLGSNEFQSLPRFGLPVLTKTNPKRCRRPEKVYISSQ